MNERDAEWRDEYPFGSNYWSIEGARLHYLDEGAGDPLLFVHGNPTWSFYWRKPILALRGRLRCVAIDHIGCGLSDKPAEYHYRLSRHIENLIGLIEHLDLERITLVAHDWGGAIGLGAATRRPDRFARVVLLNTAAFPPPYVPWRIRACRIPVLGGWAVRGANLFARAALTMAVHDRRALDAKAKAGLIAPYDSWANRIATHRFVQDIPTHRRHPTWDELERIESDLKLLVELPSQLIWGMRDWCFRPICLERLQSHFRQAEVLRLEDVGHYVVEEAPDRVIAALEAFTAKHPLAADPARQS